MKAPKNKFPKGWNDKKVKELIGHYENQTEDEATAEDEAAYHSTRVTMMAVPVELEPEVRAFLARSVKSRRPRKASNGRAPSPTRASAKLAKHNTPTEVMRQKLGRSAHTIHKKANVERTTLKPTSPPRPAKAK